MKRYKVTMIVEANHEPLVPNMAAYLDCKVIEAHHELIPNKYMVEGVNVAANKFYSLNDAKIYAEAYHEKGFECTIIEVYKEEMPIKYRVEGKEVVDQNFYNLNEARDYAESLHQKGYACTIYQAIVNCPPRKLVQYFGDPDAD